MTTFVELLVNSINLDGTFSHLLSVHYLCLQNPLYLLHCFLVNVSMYKTPPLSLLIHNGCSHVHRCSTFSYFSVFSLVFFCQKNAEAQQKI